MIFTLLLFLLACPHGSRTGVQADDLSRTSEQADLASGQADNLPRTSERADLANEGFVYPSTCAPPNVTQMLPSLQGQLTLPPIPALPYKYQVRVEASFLDKNYTMSAVEFYDTYNNKAAIRTLSNGTKLSMIYDYKNDQILYNKDGTCTVTELKYDANNMIFGLKQHGGSSHPLTATAALHMAASNGLTYMGKSTVRGIPVDHWQSCMYWTTLMSNFTLDWYFSEYDWKTPDLTHQVPVRAETVGIAGYHGHFTSFHHIYDYFDFRVDDWDESTVFQTPEGVVCPGRKDTKPLPSVPNSFSVRQEIVNPSDQSVMVVDEWFDYDHQVVRFDNRINAQNNVLSYIQDFTTGITYTIDRKLKNCSIMSISNTTYTVNVNTSTTPSGRLEHYLTLKTGARAWFLDATYVYTGQRTVRGIMCDVFISRNTNLQFPGYYPVFNSTFEMYFLQSSWVSQSNTGLTTPTAIPIHLKITTPDWVGYDVSYNFYNFDDEKPPLETYDITSCYNSSTMRPVRITFPTGGYDTNQLVAHKADLLASAIQALTVQSRMPILRVQKPMIYLDQYNIYFIATLLDVPPAKAFFQEQLGYSMTGTHGRQLNGLTEEACASACNSVADPCDAFDFCASTGTCTLYTTRAAGDLVPSNTCGHYTRTVKTYVDTPTLERALNDLDDAVSSDKLHLSLNTTANGSQLKTFRATRLNIVDNEGKPAGYYPVIG